MWQMNGCGRWGDEGRGLDEVAFSRLAAQRESGDEWEESGYALEAVAARQNSTRSFRKKDQVGKRAVS